MCGKNVEFFSQVEAHVRPHASGLETLKKVDEHLKFSSSPDEHESLRCLVPVAQYFPTMGAIVLTDKFFITVQTTVASTYGTKSIGFEKVYGNLPFKFVAKRQRIDTRQNSMNAPTKRRPRRLRCLMKKVH